MENIEKYSIDFFIELKLDLIYTWQTNTFCHYTEILDDEFLCGYPFRVAIIVSLPVTFSSIPI